jgi:hypothetical protein
MMLRAVLAALPVVCAHLAGAGSAALAAQHPPRSLYTTVDIKKCKSVQRHKDGDAWLCKGLPGYPLYVAEGDMRYFMSAGPQPDKRRAATQTLGPFNHPFEGKSKRITVEWRFYEKIDGRKVPYATIVRFFTSNNSAKGEVLVVNRITDRDTCQLVVVDALANSDAIVIARAAADERARNADCKGDPIADGASGKSPM